MYIMKLSLSVWFYVHKYYYIYIFIISYLLDVSYLVIIFIIQKGEGLVLLTDKNI